MRYRSKLIGQFGTAGAFALVALAGCGPRTPRIESLDQWARRMDDIGLVAVIPPSEDVRVGDIFALGVDPNVARTQQERRETAKLVAASTRWSSLPVLDDLGREYSQRRSWPKTPDAVLRVATNPEERTWLEPASPGGSSIFAAEEIPGPPMGGTRIT